MLASIHAVFLALFKLQRRVDPFLRSIFARLLEGPLTSLVQAAGSGSNLGVTRQRASPPSSR